MRIDRFLLFVLLLATSYGCSEEQPYEVEKESVSIWEGDTRHVIIETDLTEHNYKLESENQEIATATLDEMGVCIATYKSGSTMIRLIDTDNNKIVCNILQQLGNYQLGNSVRRSSWFSGNNNKSNRSKNPSRDRN